MDNYYKIFSFIFFTCLFCQCKNGSTKEVAVQGPTINCDFSNIQEEKSDSIFNKVAFVALEAKNGKLLGHIDKVEIINKKIYCKTKDNITVFDTDGKFLFNIFNKGEGPNQYKSITDFFVKDKIEILDSRGRKVFEYDLNGKFIENWSFPLFAVRFNKIDDLHYLFYSSNTPNEESNYMVNLVSKESSKVMGKYIEIEPNKIDYFQYLDQNNFLDFNGLTFFMSGSHYAYKIVNDKFIPIVAFNLNGIGIPQETYKKKFNDVSYFDNYLKNKEIIDFLNTFYLENNNYIIAGLTKQRIIKYWVVYDKKKDSSVIVDNLIIPVGEKKLRIKFNPDNNPVGISSNFIIISFEPEQFVEEINKSNLSLNDFPNLSNNQNQILLIGELKNK